MRRLGVFVWLFVAAACAVKPIVAPTVSSPKFPDFIAPVVPSSLASSAAVGFFQRGWLSLQAGDLKDAEWELAAALRIAPAFYPAEIGLGYLELARNDARAALAHFDRVLDKPQRDLSVLVGRGQALVILDRDGDALDSFAAALAVDPAAGDVARRVEVLRFRGQQKVLTLAREAAEAGRVEEAVSLYKRAIAGSPDSAFLYRELAAAEVRAGDPASVLEHLGRAVALDPGDARSQAQIGEILEAQNDFTGAMNAYTQALASEPTSDLEAKRERLRARIELSRLPSEYQAIDGASQMTRAELAALVGVRLGALLQTSGRRDAALMTDIRNNWAVTWIVMVAGAGIMEPFANYAFQPRTIVRRIDLAEVVSRLLDRLAEAAPAQPHPWQSVRIRFADLAEDHLAYPAASAAVASGVLTKGSDDSFQPLRPVSGREAVGAIDRIDAMARTAIPRGTAR